MENVVRKFLEEHILFKAYSNSNFMDSLAKAMKPRMFADGAFIIKKGEIGRAMFINLKGTVDVISEDGESVVGVMEEGAFFGEIAVLYSIPRTVSCRSRGKSIILVLTKEEFHKTLEPYPQIAASIALIAEQRYALHVKKVESNVNDTFGEELHTCMTQNELRNIPLFRDCEIEFLHKLSLTLKPQKFFQNQIIIQKGDVAREMYFVSNGTAHVVDESGTIVYAEFTAGCFFGEVGLFQKANIRTSTVRCASASMLIFKCEKADMDTLLVDFPNVQMKISRETTHRLNHITQRETSNLTPELFLATEVESIRERLKLVPLLSNCTITFLHDLALHMKVRRFAPGAIVVSEGDTAKSLFIIIAGTVEIVSKDLQNVYAEMSENSYFGEVSLFYDVNRTATVRSRDEATLVELKKDVFAQVLRSTPALSEKLSAAAEENYMNHCQRTKGRNHVAMEDEVVFERLKQVSIFENCDIGFLRTLANKTVYKSYTKGDIVVKKGDQAQDMYFIAEGTVEVVSENLEVVYDKIEKGDFFGEIGIIQGLRRTETVRVASNRCSLLLIAATTIKEVVGVFPNSYQSIVLASDSRYKKTQQRSTHDEVQEEPQNLLIRPQSKELPILGGVLLQNGIQAKNKKGILKINSVSSQTYAKTVLTRSKPESNQGKSINLKTRHILTLTDFELQIVISKLSFRDMVHLRCVCRQLRDQLQSYIFWEKVDLRPLSRTIDSIFLDSLFDIVAENLLDLDLGKCWKIDDSNIQNLTNKCKNLRKLSVADCWKLSDLSLTAIVTNLKSLRRLNVSHCSKFTGSGFYQHQLKQLKYLDISHCKGISDKNFEALLKSTPEMLGIKMRRCSRITDFGIFLIVRYCRQIRSLDLTDCEQLTDRCLKWISTSCESLIDINFTFCKGMTTLGFQHLAQAKQKFRKLDFSYCIQVSDDTLRLFTQPLSRLEWLSVRHCHNMTDGVSIHLSKEARKLMFLNVTGCSKVSDSLFVICKATNKKLSIHSDKKESNSKRANQAMAPVCFEVRMCDIFTSGPKQLMDSGFLKNENHKHLDLNIKRFIKSRARVSYQSMKQRNAKQAGTISQ
ncbi:hypothetical protein BC833DRAFT_573403 [Globomyces pollinis-pini]|nr:hypothetical protein BC833DRAFT_573403 [Globomyces pollinis-pini]